MNVNPIIKLDYPDVDAIRVDDTYYMISTTMHFFPGGEILKSKDLINWEHATFIYDRLDSTPEQKLENGQNIYGKGMWAASLRYHNGIFYVVFVCNDTQKTYLYTSKSISGPWAKSNIEGFYHDSSLLFDDDRIFIVYGNRQIYLTELDSELKGPKEGGINKVIIEDSKKTPLGYEGAHFYKINGKYYIFLIHSKEDRWFRTEACFVSDTVDGEYTGKDILENDMGYCNQGIAQGGIVDTKDGHYYAILFQDRGAVGRIPVLIPMIFENDFPKLLEDEITNINIQYDTNVRKCIPLSSSDDFNEEGPSFGLKSFWQFNHEPDLSLCSIDLKKGTWTVTTQNTVTCLTQAKNMITQRLFWPSCHVEVTVDASMLNDGDYAGLCVLQGAYGFSAITKDNGEYFMVMHSNECNSSEMMSYEYTEYEKERIPLTSPVATLSFDADFMNMKDTVKFNIGPSHKMYFKLDHFAGNRAGLFIYSTKKAGGSATFTHFVLN